MSDPRLYLTIDNCFASKRWTRPAEWVDVIHGLGVAYIEASADNECDPLYMGEDYLRSWQDELLIACDKREVKVANLYSGHGTYATLGLAHTDSRIRDRMQESWLKPMSDLAARIGAGFGFFCHAFSDSTLQSPAAYDEAERDLYARLGALAKYCREIGVRTPGVEQMYTPHQIPWTIEGAKRLLREVFTSSNSPFYLTLDTGHQSGQRRFSRLAPETIAAEAAKARQGIRSPQLWLGPLSAHRLFEEMVGQSTDQDELYLQRIELEMDRYPYLFAEQNDGDTYVWLRELAAYSPIIHLQQTNGSTSSHWPFTDEMNRQGIVFGDRVLEAIAESYRSPIDETLPPRCEELYLTLEIFSGTSEMNSDIIRKLEESVRYWRRFIPTDGMRLSEALSFLESRRGLA